jgi:hypothetical protein
MEPLVVVVRRLGGPFPLRLRRRWGPVGRSHRASAPARLRRLLLVHPDSLTDDVESLDDK